MSVVVNADLTVAYASDSGYIFNTGISAAAPGGSGGSSGADAPGVTPTSPEKKPEGSDEIAPWGDDNLFPQNVIKDIEKNTILPSVLEKKTSMMYGGGLVYGIITGKEKDGRPIFEAQTLPEVDEFIEYSRLDRYAFEGLHDISTFANAFPELILSKNRQKVKLITIQEAAWCRYLKPKKGTLPGVVINANWDNGGKPGDEFSTTVPTIDPYFDAVGNLRSRTDGFKYIYPLSIPSPDKALYQLASWNSVRRSGWLDVAAAIPEFKKMLFKNQLTVKYLIEVHSAYWVWKYGDWDGLTRDEKKKLLEDEIQAFNDVMQGTNGAGKTVMTTTIMDPKTNQEVAAFKITAIDDKLKDGIYIEDSQEASSHIYTAVGVAPSLMGVSPGKGMGGGAGGGSEPRVLFNNFVSTSQFHLDLLLAPLNLISRYNGWQVNGKPVVWRFLNPFIMTQAESQPKQQESK
ncbi:hypothetical protein [Hymenobacter psychrotolerans]|uniref:Uncharacterized protein n=1 Tax=Hymenobacter psychrotolerans DSM 18569 TaxID=1121959 RepID=A0A1M6Z7K2_9BACT|nr:hypothetical protein [Hymenobacter psychrotolerans]SHL26437.1 hypothetical protein SAMN02746009_02447 [Hymenobacter psychrotolerans DSM 18569]